MQPLTPDRWQQIDALFAAALERSAAEQPSFLAAACGADAELRDAVQRLLDNAAAAELAIGESATAFAPELIPSLRAAEAAAETQLIGRRVGAYRILEEIGRGGMGAVYRAERADGVFEKRVALKLVKRGMDTDEILARFRRERGILASLEHPCIARLYDGGATDDDRPFLVMELVDGQPITTFCDAHRLDVEQRLRIFLRVCDAVQHAHRKLIVHRDIKPSNILVTTDGTPKLLDFGIARLLVDDDEASRTRSGIRILTPEYAAPEQVRGEPATTAIDVYALGAVLHELLTGRTPRRQEDTGMTDGARQRPGAVMPTEAAAAARGTTAGRLQRRLRGDLDTITLTALAPEPARRYGSVQQLRDDIERHLQRVPVQARPPTAAYRLARFARRNRSGVAVAAATLAALAGLAMFHSVRITGERDRARAEADKARATTRFLQDMLSDASPAVALGDAFSMSDLLARAVVRIDSMPGQPDVQAELLRTIAGVYREQGRFDEALPLILRAVAMHEGSADPRSRQAGQALSELGHLHDDRKEYEAAFSAHAASIEIFRRLGAAGDSARLFATNNLAAAAMALERFDDAVTLYQQVLAQRRPLFADTSQLVHVTHNNVGVLHDYLGNHADAAHEFREALRLRRAALPANHPSIALTLNNLGTVLLKLGAVEEAEQLQLEAYEIWIHVHGPDHHRVALAAYNLAAVYERSGRLDEAESLFRRTVEIDRATYGSAHLEVGYDLRRLGLVQKLKGDCAAAIGSLAEAEAIFAAGDVPLTESRRSSVRTALDECRGRNSP